MRILLMSSSGAVGGAERVLLDLAGAMRARGHDIAVIASDLGPLADRASGGAHVEVLPFPPRFASLGESGRSRATVLADLPLVALPVARYLSHLRRIVSHWSPDIVHTHGTKAHVLAAWAGLPGRLVWHLHELAGRRPVSARLLRLSAGRVSGAIAVSSSVAADFRALAPACRTWTIPNGVDLERFAPGGPCADLDAASGLPPAPPDTLRVGLVATYAWWKGHDVFLQALARTTADRPVRGYIVGGPIYATRGASQVERPALEATIRALGLEGRVGLAGFIEDVPAVMRALDVVVHASTEPEPFGLTIAEGMACGRAVIASGTGGAAEIVRDGATAVTHQPGDVDGLARAIDALVADPALRARLGQSARESAEEHFDARRAADAVDALYRGLAGDAA
jgi:glycosyltransferase involved in cell wall biosynthesis